MMLNCWDGWGKKEHSQSEMSGNYWQGGMDRKMSELSRQVGSRGQVGNQGIWLEDGCTGVVNGRKKPNKEKEGNWE